MARDFDLGVILSFTTDVLLVEKMESIHELARFILNDPFIGDIGILAVKDIIKNHILQLYPNLKDVYYMPIFSKNINSWLAVQKALYGERLLVCPFGHTLEEENDLNR